MLHFEFGPRLCSSQHKIKFRGLLQTLYHSGSRCNGDCKWDSRQDLCVPINATTITNTTTTFNHTVSKNNTLIKSPHFPHPAPAGTHEYNIRTCQADICQYRLEFEQVELGAPESGDCTADKLMVRLHSGLHSHLHHLLIKLLSVGYL